MVPDISLSVSDRIDLDALPLPEVLVLSLSALLWLLVLRGWLPGPGPAPAGLEAAMDAPGVPEAMAVANGLSGIAAYLLAWGAMMSAMMLPSLLPAVREYRDDLCSSPTAFLPSTGVFLAAYGLAWTLVGAVPLAVAFVVPIHDLVTAPVLGAFAVAALFAFAGGYQLTSLKRALLARCGCCRSLPHRPDAVRMAREGLEYAGNCIGCTWPLFALMVGLGSMNPVVMLGLTLVVSLERLAPDGEAVARAWGVVLLGAAAVTFLFAVVPV